MPTKVIKPANPPNAHAHSDSSQNGLETEEHSHSGSDSEPEEHSEPPEPHSVKKKRQRSGFSRKKSIGSSSSSTISSKKERSSKKHRSKKHKHKRKHQEEDSDQETPRKPLGTVYCNNQKLQRLENHPSTMAKTKNTGNNKRSLPGREAKGTKKNKLDSKAAAKRDNSDDEDADSEAPSSKMAGVAAQKVIIKLQKDYQKYRDRPKGQGQYEKSNMEKEVVSVSKKWLFKRQKIIDAEGLKKATVRVREMIKPTDLQGLPPDVEAEAIEIWDNHYSDLVRVALNEKRNNIQQEVRKLLLHLAEDDNHKDSVTFDPDTIKDLVFRQGFEKLKGAELEAWHAKMDLLVDQIVPKVANSTAWGENFRHTAPMYCAMQVKPGVEDPDKCVTVTDLAYLWAIFANYQAQWDWDLRRIRKQLKPFPDDYANEAARGKQSIVDPDDPSGKKLMYFESKPDTKWTKSEGGRCQFGGWSKEGFKTYLECAKQLQKEMKKSASLKRIKKVDEGVLQRLRELHNRENVEKKRHARKKKTVLVEEESDLEDEMDLFDE